MEERQKDLQATLKYMAEVSVDQLQDFRMEKKREQDHESVKVEWGKMLLQPSEAIKIDIQAVGMIRKETMKRDMCGHGGTA